MTFIHLPVSVRLLDLSVTLLSFMTGTSCCVEPLNRAMVNFFEVVVVLHDFRCYLRVASSSLTPLQFSTCEYIVTMVNTLFLSQDVFYNKSVKYLFFEEQNKKFNMNILCPAVIRINCKYSTRSFLFKDIQHICPRAVFFEDAVDLFLESYTLCYRNFYTSSAIRSSLCFWSLTFSLLWSFWHTGFKCSCLRASLFTVLRVVYAIVRLIQNICHSTIKRLNSTQNLILLRTQHEVPFLNMSDATKRSSDRTENGKSTNVTKRTSRIGSQPHFTLILA